MTLMRGIVVIHSLDDWHWVSRDAKMKMGLSSRTDLMKLDKFNDCTTF